MPEPSTSPLFFREGISCIPHLPNFLNNALRAITLRIYIYIYIYIYIITVKVQRHTEGVEVWLHSFLTLAPHAGE
jgi:hypothetical protein